MDIKNEKNGYKLVEVILNYLQFIWVYEIIADII